MIRILSTLERPPLIVPPGSDVAVETVPAGTGRGWRVIRDAVGRGAGYDAIVLDGSVGVRGGYADRLAAALIRARRRPPRVVLADCTWKRGISRLDRLAGSAAIRLLDAPHVTFCVLSTDEVRLFPPNWGVDHRRVAFTPWPYTFSHVELEGASADGAVFSGGESMRDYRSLVDAAAWVDAPVRIAANRGALPSGPLPPNVETGRVSHRTFVDLMRRASVVVVALASSNDRSAGQQTYLNAMAMGKPVVATDALGVRDYIEHRRTGLIVPIGDPNAMREAIGWTLDPGNRAEVEEMGRQARADARGRFSPEAYAASVVEVVHDALGRAGKSRG